MGAQLDTYYHAQAKKGLYYSIAFTALFLLCILAAGWLIATTRAQWIFFLILSILGSILLYRLGWKETRIWRRLLKKNFPASYRIILHQYVPFYTSLNEAEKRYFEQRMLYFLSRKKITGVQCDITDKDLVFISAAAIMPVYSFPAYFYPNINEILVYPNSFDEEFNLKDGSAKARIAGMVGNGALHRMMLLSQVDLRKSFQRPDDGHNVGVHEFVHLIDMADGAVDGIPRLLLSRQATIPWIAQMHREMKDIFQKRSDIDPYALTHESEFLAVVSEYFFESPDRFMEKHPGLYESLVSMFSYKK